MVKDNKKIVIKIGSSTITSEDGTINKKFLKNLASQVDTLRSMGKSVIIVSSGARIAGVNVLGKWSKKEDINYKQALCAMGQVELMNSYRKIFGEYDMHIGQILLTKEDFSNEARILNIKNTVNTLLDEGIIPIINENDTVCVEEIKIGDNDMLAAYTTVLLGGDMLVLLSDIEGVYDKNPQDNPDAQLIEEIRDIDELERNISTENKSSFGTGGMVTKIKAAREVTVIGADLVVAQGSKENIIIDLFNNNAIGSIFIAQNRK